MTLRDIDYIIPMCHLLQLHMAPLSIITQSSPIYSNHRTNYVSFRLRLHDSVSGSRTGVLPSDIHDMKDFQDYCKHLPNQKDFIRNALWFDIFPKPIFQNHQLYGYRIEVRIADTSEFSKLFVYSQAMLLTFLSLFQQLKNHHSYPALEHRWYILNRDHILKNGKEAILTIDGLDFYNIEDYLKLIWRPMVTEHAIYLGLDINNLIVKLLGKSRSDEMILKFEHMSGLEIAHFFAMQDLVKYVK